MASPLEIRAHSRRQPSLKSRHADIVKCYGASPSGSLRPATDYRLPYWKVGLDEASLFRQLQERFNAVCIFIYDFDAFHYGVNDTLCFRQYRFYHTDAAKERLATR
jgi:hypothetical protein